MIYEILRPYLHLREELGAMRLFPILVLLLSLSLANPPVLMAATLGAPTDVAFTASYDGTAQLYSQLLPTDFDPTKQYDVIIALHGSGSNRTQYASNTRDECRATRDVAANHDMIMICPDYRASTSWMNAAAESDVLQIIANLKTQYNIGKTIVTGASMGGTGSLTFTALHPNLVDGVCAVNGLANFFNYTSDNPSLVPQVQAAFGGTQTQVPQEYTKRSAIFSPQSFVMPMAVTAGMQDATVPPQSVIQLANTVKNTNPVNPNVVSFIRADGGHSTNYVDNAVALEYVVQNAKGINTDLHPITVNKSFEYQNLAVGATTPTVDGWTVTGAAVGIANYSAATRNAKFNGGLIPDGSEVAYVTYGALTQFTGTTIRAGTYHLSLDTASGKDNAAVGTFLTGFMAGSDNVANPVYLPWAASNSYTDGPALTAGNWTTINFDWVVPADSTSIGKNLYVNYYATSASNTMYFDNVSVSFTPVPEPSTLAMLAVGLIAFVAWAGKKRMAM
jgi:predicted esterase